MMSRPGLTILWALLLAILCHAGPINRQAGGHNTLRPDIRNQSYTEHTVCVNDDVLYQPGDLMPAPNPCSRCVCSPPGSLCTHVACEKKPGCKALQRPNQCCPEYQCECERNGRLYANGERLDNADNPCQACYCQGGEVVCTTVECYRRDDCEPQFVPGRCCPKYDHCPPLVMDESRYGESFTGGDRPQHTRATFQPNGGLEGETDPADPAEDDQALGASNVQERVHVPQVATATTTAAPASEAPASVTNAPVAAATEAAAAETDAPTGTNAPTTNPPQHDTPRDAAIKIDVPAVPWTETPEPSATDATTLVPAQNDDEGSGATEGETILKKIDEPVIGVIERIHLDTNPQSVEETATGATTAVKDDTTEAQTEQEPITRLFMLSKEAELDPTTVSTEYTDIPEEMSTLPETTAPAKETTVAAKGVDLSTEALLEATTTKESPSAPEVSTDGSPEFKDFDEWSASKSSEFLRDSASIGSSGGASSGSDAHSKPAGSSSDESRSQILATNINAETVKLSSDQGSVPHSEGSSTDSTESADSTEESSTTEIVSSTENENAAKNDGKQEIVPGTKLDESDSKEEIPLLQKINEEQSNENVKDEEKNDSESSEKDKRQPDIVLDTEATDENGPPILLIGDDLANHQMDIVVATSSTEEAETETPSVNEKPEQRLNQQASTDQPTEASDSATDSATEESAVTTETQDAGNGNSAVVQKSGIEADVAEDPRTEEPTSATDASATDDALYEQARTEAGSGDGAKDAGSSTEKLDVATVAEEMMMSDDPLPGQAASSETVQRNENLDDLLGKTDDKKEDSVDAQSATVLTTLSIDSATEDPVEIRLGELKTESPERESTTNTDKEEERTTLEPKYEAITDSGDNNLDGKQEENQDETEEKVVERRADMPEQEAKEEVTTEEAGENPITTESSITERVNAEVNEPTEHAESVKTPNEESFKEHVDERAQHTENQEKSETDTNQSPEHPPKDTTTIVADLTDVPTTQIPVKDTTIDFFEEWGLMLGDQPQSSLPATRLQTIESKEQKKEEVKEQKKENEELKKDMEGKVEASTDNTDTTESGTETIQTNEPEQTTEIKERVKSDDISESTPKPGTGVLSESYQTTVLEQNTESAQKSEANQPEQQKIQEETNVELETKGEWDQKSEVNPEQQQVEKEEEASQTLVDNAKTTENDEVAVGASLEQKISSDDHSTPPSDTTSSDAKIQDETITSLPGKNDNMEEAPSTVIPLDTTTKAHPDVHSTEPTDMGVKINPEVLELKPSGTATPAASNASQVTTYEPDSSTLSPEWLKTENATKEETAQGDKGPEQQQQQVNESEAPAAVTEHHVPPTSAVTGDVAGDADGGGEQPRVERRVDETDKKDLFLLEDFFTKLYRHQIATDANKER